jgi:hypothetical protein
VLDGSDYGTGMHVPIEAGDSIGRDIYSSHFILLVSPLPSLALDPRTQESFSETRTSPGDLCSQYCLSERGRSRFCKRL